MKQISENRCFGGSQLRFQHTSSSLNCDMVFSVFLPNVAKDRPVPLLYWLSGLTCNDENFVTKAGAQRYANEHGIAIIAADTSPRGDGVPEDTNGAYDFGLGAGFYINATQVPWQQHYQMYDYITEELPALLQSSDLPIDHQRVAISGHSMGGHGALTIALKNPQKYRSVSAFSPISSPMQCPWGEKALSGYLGDNQENWKAYDAAELMTKATQPLPCLVDHGAADVFLSEQLKPTLLQAAAKQSNYPAEIRIQKGYNHSYFFIASFIGEHIAFHAKYLID